jgi:hypothetical protein
MVREEIDEAVRTLDDVTDALTGRDDVAIFARHLAVGELESHETAGL